MNNELLETKFCCDRQICINERPNSCREKKMFHKVRRRKFHSRILTTKGRRRSHSYSKPRSMKKLIGKDIRKLMWLIKKRTFFLIMFLVMCLHIISWERKRRYRKRGKRSTILGKLTNGAKVLYSAPRCKLSELRRMASNSNLIKE